MIKNYNVSVYKKMHMWLKPQKIEISLLEIKWNKKLYNRMIRE